MKNITDYNESRQYDDNYIYQKSLELKNLSPTEIKMRDKRRKRQERMFNGY